MALSRRDSEGVTVKLAQAGLAALVAVAMALGTVGSAAAQGPAEPAEPAEPAATNVDVRVWQQVTDSLNVYISARPEGGSWAALGTIPLPLDDGFSSSGSYRYGDITVEGVEVRVWQRVSNARTIHISARPVGGSWDTLGTIPLPLDDGFSSSGTYRYGDITVDVPLADTPPPEEQGGTESERVCRWNETAAHVVASTVKVTTPTVTGSAFYVGNGQFVTAGHVVEDRPSQITLGNDHVSTTARLVGFYEFDSGDVALLSASAPGLTALEWAGTLTIGTDIAIAGYPEALGTNASWTRGTVSRVFTAGGVSYLQTDAASSPGNSGGPLVDACGRVAGIISSSYVGERGSEGLHFAVAEPTLGRRLINLGLRGYQVAEGSAAPTEEGVGAGSLPRSATYSGAARRRQPPEGTTIAAVVGGVVCDTFTIGPPRYGEVSFALTVEEGCGGAAPGVPVAFTASGQPLTDAYPQGWNMGWGLMEEHRDGTWSAYVSCEGPQPLYWGESLRLAIAICPNEVQVESPPTSEAIDSYLGSAGRIWNEASANIEAGNNWWYRTDSPYSCTPRSACFVSWAARMVRELDSYQGPALQESAFKEWRAAARAWWEAVDTWIRKAAFEPSAPLHFYAQREDEAWDRYKQAACRLYAFQGYADDPRRGITGDSTDRIFPECAATP